MSLLSSDRYISLLFPAFISLIKKNSNKMKLQRNLFNTILFVASAATPLLLKAAPAFSHASASSTSSPYHYDDPLRKKTGLFNVVRRYWYYSLNALFSPVFNLDLTSKVQPLYCFLLLWLLRTDKCKWPHRYWYC